MRLHKFVVGIDKPEMPRKSLPSTLKTLSTVGVLVTQTKEEDLWSTFLSGVEVVKQDMEKWNRYANEVLDRFLYGNPYDNSGYHRLWRNQYNRNRSHWGPLFDDGRPFKEGKWWNNLRNEELEEHTNSLSRELDFRKMGTILKWEGRPEYDAFMEIHNRTKLPSSFESDLKHYEGKRFEEAFEKWKKADAEWVGHNTNLQRCITECSFCEKEKKERDEREARYQEHMRQQEEEEKEREERERRRQQELRDEWERRKRIPTVRHTCEACDFTTTHGALYREHCLTAEHIRKEKHKSWYCVACQHQCRSQIEHLNHLTTKKHKVAAGIVEGDPDVFVCEACAFSTPTKHVYQVHCQSKRHLIATGELEKHEKEEKQYVCLPCGYSTNNKQHYAVHCISQKHIAKNNSS